MKKYKKNAPQNYISLVETLHPGLRVKQITLQVTEDCCLNCSYCYQHHKTHTRMTFDIAKIFIDNLLNDKIEGFTKNDIGGVVLDFIGGEPLMEINLITQIWEYFYQQLILLNHPWLFHVKGSLCSNGILYFNTEVQNFFKKYHSIFSFTISIDGNKQLHDACRVDYSGKGSYDRAIAAVHHYRETFQEEVLTKMTISPENVMFLYDAVTNLIHEGYTDIFLNCIFEEGWNNSHAAILYKEMIKIADYIIDNELNDKIYISLFEEDYFVPIDISDNMNWCGGVGNSMLALSPTGEYYTCIRYMESSLNGHQPALVLGNLTTGYLTTQKDKENNAIISNITRRSQSTDECFYCPIAKGCSWCSAHNYEVFGTPNKRTTYICCMHKARALANVYYWNKIYSKYNIDKKFPNYLGIEGDIYYGID